MPLTGIQLLFETLLRRTRELCKCENRKNGFKDCNGIGPTFREPNEIGPEFSCCIAKFPAGCAAMLDSAGRAS
jgi:hypothetical protein